MEPLVSSKIKQLDIISEQRRNTSLSHRFHCIKKERKMKKNIARKLHANVETFNDSYVSFGCDDDLDEQDYSSSNDCDISDVTPEDGGMKTRRFDEMTTFENKTICLISRYPFWTAFRRFLSHLHILSRSTIAVSSGMFFLTIDASPSSQPSSCIPTKIAPGNSRQDMNGSVNLGTYGAHKSNGNSNERKSSQTSETREGYDDITITCEWGTKID